MNENADEPLRPKSMPDPKFRAWEAEQRSESPGGSGEMPVARLRNGAQQDVQRAVNTDVRVLHGQPGEAERLSERHNSLCRGPSIILATELRVGDPANLERLRESDPDLWRQMEKDLGGEEMPIGCSKPLNIMGGIAQRRGYFLMPYSPEKEQGILTDPLCVVTEASAAHPDSPENRAPVADCQSRLSEPGAGARFEDILEPPTSSDPIFCDAIFEQITERPWSVGLVEDIACQDTHPVTGQPINDLGCAGIARRANFHQIENGINPQRGEYPIRYMGAAIASVQGIIRPDGTEIRLGSLQESSIKNDRSIMIHSEGRNPAKLGYKLENRRVPILYGENGELDYQAIVNWYMYFHDFNNFDREARAALAETHLTQIQQRPPARPK